MVGGFVFVLEVGCLVIVFVLLVDGDLGEFIVLLFDGVVWLILVLVLVLGVS